MGCYLFTFTNETSKIYIISSLHSLLPLFHQLGLPACRAIICFCYLSFRTFCCLGGSLICTESVGIIFFACMSICIQFLEIRQRIMISEVGSDDEMFPCSLEPAIAFLFTSKIVPSI